MAGAPPHMDVGKCGRSVRERRGVNSVERGGKDAGVLLPVLLNAGQVSKWQ